MSAEFTQAKDSLVDKILEQGQRLRNAMVQSILLNDPLSADVLLHPSKKYNTPVSSGSLVTDRPTEDKKLLNAFLHGDYLTKDEEELALNTLRSMSASEVCATTDRTLHSKCVCVTCTAYNSDNLKCDLRRNPVVTKQCHAMAVQQTPCDTIVLKQVDSLKVVLQSINLNSLGEKKVNRGLSTHVPKSSLNETYFVEYSLPEVFTKDILRSKSKIDSGLENHQVRICARRTNDGLLLSTYCYFTVCSEKNNVLTDIYYVPNSETHLF